MKLNKLRRALNDWSFTMRPSPTLRAAMLAELDMAEAAVEYCQAGDDLIAASESMDHESPETAELVKQAEERYDRACEAWAVARDAAAKSQSN
jgi:hypothetical protein